MLYRFSNTIENQLYEFSIDFENNRCRGIVDFEFPKSKNIGVLIGRIASFIDFNNLENTLTSLKSKGFVLQNKKNYVKLFCDIYQMIYETTYKTPVKEAAMLHTVLNCSESEATKLFNLFLISNEYWSKPKTISVFCKNVNEVRRLMVAPKVEPLRITTPSIVNAEKVVYLTQVSEISLDVFQQEVNKYNKNMGTNLSNIEFADKFHFQIQENKVLTPPKK